MRYRLRGSSNEKLHGVNGVIFLIVRTLLHVAFRPFRIFSSSNRLLPIHLSPIQIQCFCILRIKKVSFGKEDTDSLEEHKRVYKMVKQNLRNCITGLISYTAIYMLYIYIIYIYVFFYLIIFSV